jgi:hypothetical protein
MTRIGIVAWDSLIAPQSFAVFFMSKWNLLYDFVISFSQLREHIR